MKVNTKSLLSLCALYFGIIGSVLLFFPQEISEILSDYNNLTILEHLGALYYGFAMVNWMSKGIRIGGIYNRPLAIGNFAYFAISSVTIIKFVLSRDADWIVLLLSVVQCSLAIIFGKLIFTSQSANEVTAKG
ncbi:MAG: hypothetical protein RLN86_05485 [Cyclobacteriaceae bacterium]